MKTGIYKIINITTNKIYVGSAINIFKRWNEHRRSLNNNKHRNKYLQRSWNKYGEIDFLFSIIEETTVENLIIKEQYFIDILNVCNRYKGFNMSPTAGNSLGIKRSKKFKNKIRNSRKGSILSETHKTNIGNGVRQSKKYRDAINSAEYKNNKRIANLGNKNPMFGKCGKKHVRSKSINQYTKDGLFIKNWESVNMAADGISKSQGNISSCCSGRIKMAYGYIWKYNNVTPIEAL